MKGKKKQVDLAGHFLDKVHLPFLCLKINLDIEIYYYYVNYVISKTEGN